MDIECSKTVSDPSTVTWDLSPLQKVLEASFPGQDAAIQQVMADAQQGLASIMANPDEDIPAQRVIIDGRTVSVGPISAYSPADITF